MVNAKLEHAGFFVLRTPTFPWDIARNWSFGLEAPAATSGADLQAALERDVALLRARLREVVKVPLVRGAIEAASPSLGARLDPWLSGENGDAAAAVEPAVTRYLMRMTARATPFGLFAASSFGIAGDRTALRVSDECSLTRKTRIDLDWLFAFAVRASREPQVRPHLCYRANPTIYRLGPRYRYFGVRIGELPEKPLGLTYHLCDVSSSPALDAVVAEAVARDGATITELAGTVSALDDADRATAHAYVLGLVEAQLLQPTLLPAVTGDDPLGLLLEELRSVQPLEGAYRALASARELLEKLDAAPVHEAAALSRSITEIVSPIAPDAEWANLLRVDLQRRAPGLRLNHRVLGEVAAAANLLASLMPETEPPLERFMSEFVERYQDREVPLLEALDPDTGVGFEHTPGVDASALVRGLSLDADPKDGRWTERDRFLLGRLCATLERGDRILVLGDEDIAALASRAERAAPPGGTLLVTIAASSCEAVDRGDYRVLVHAGGFETSSALFGRFLNDDEQLRARVSVASRREEAHEGGAIHAEIAHHPEGQASNVSHRPLLRDYEIAVGVGSCAPAARRIAPADLLLSVRRGRLVLRSRAHGREVVPHLSTAHAYRGPGLALYRFLALLQTQGRTAGVAWDWGALGTAPFLPRVTHERFVLSLATWRIPGPRVAAIAKLEPAAGFRALRELRLELGLPRLVSLVDNDNVLPVDLDNVFSTASFLSICKKRRVVELVERFPGDDLLCAKGETGDFHHELAVPLLQPQHRPLAAAAAPLAPARPAEASPDETRLPGEDWLFAKIYCGSGSSERVLLDVVAPLVDELRREELLDRWFFIRYADPKWHLRVRFRGERARIWSVAPRLFGAISSSRHLVHRVTLDTYEPEVERYGGSEAHPLAERVFEADSDAALRLVRHARRDPEARWRAALLGMDGALGALDFSLHERRHIVERCRDDWAATLRCGPATLRQVGERYRARRAIVEGLLGGGDGEHTEVLQALRGRTRTLREVGRQLRELERRELLRASRESVAASYLHMWANRVFKGSANLHELVLYDFLHRAYGSAIARGAAAGQRVADCAE